MGDAEPVHRMAGQEGADLVRVEMIAVSDVKGKVGGGLGSASSLGKARREQEVVGMGIDVAAGAARAGVVEKGRGGVDVERGREGVEIALEADAELVGRVAGRHPFGLGKAELIEEMLELWRRSFADPDDADLRAFHQRYPRLRPAVRDQTRGHPARRAAAKDDDRLILGGVAHRRSTSPE